MAADSARLAWLAVGAVVGYLLLMGANPARASLRDGLRCLRRYPRVWLLPAGFALAHTGFTLGVHVYAWWTIRPPTTAAWPGWHPHEWGDLINAWNGWQPAAWEEVIAATWLPTGESTAAIFNCIVTTFPLSALWAALFLTNWRGSQLSLGRELRRRFGCTGGTAIQLGLLVCALAAICKPFMFFGLHILALYLGAAPLLRGGEIINGLSFLFEYLLGVSVQVYLVLLAYAWLRGLNFEFTALRRFALRRFVFVVKWALVVMTISSLGINLPLVIATFQPLDRRWNVDGMILVTRVVLAATLLIFCAMQSLLIFHNETLRRALADQWRLWRSFGWHLSWFVVVVVLHFFVLEAADVLLPSALGQWTWPGAVWRLVLHPLIWSMLASWFLVSWVCLFQRCERRQPDLDELVRY